MSNRPSRILIIDDDEDDFFITRDLLSDIKGEAFDVDWVSTYDGALEALGHNKHDVYLVDYRLGGRTGVELIREAVERGCHGPLILMTGQGDHEVDLEAMQAGAADYLAKGTINSTLLERSIRYAIERNRVEKEMESLVAQLRGALAEIKQLGGLLPICSSCKRIRDDSGYWNELEMYIRDHSDADFSHSICPICIKQLYPQHCQTTPEEEHIRG